MSSVAVVVAVLVVVTEVAVDLNDMVGGEGKDKDRGSDSGRDWIVGGGGGAVSGDKGTVEKEAVAMSVAVVVPVVVAEIEVDEESERDGEKVSATVSPTSTIVPLSVYILSSTTDWGQGLT